MASIEFAFQKAVYAALQGIEAPDATGSLAEVPVFDHQPDSQVYPYVTIAGVASSPMDALDAPSAGSVGRLSLYLAVWSQYRGQRQVIEIMSAIRDVLHGADLEIDGGECVLVRVTDQSVVGEPDDQTYQGAMTITAIVSD